MGCLLSGTGMGGEKSGLAGFLRSPTIMGVSFNRSTLPCNDMKIH